MDRNDPRAQRTQCRIVGATAELIAEHGLAALTMDGIAHHAGVSRTTLYRHVRSIEEAVTMVVAEFAPPAIASGDDEFETVRAAMRSLGESLRGEPWSSVVAGLAEAGQRQSHFAALHQRLTRSRRSPVLVALRRAVTAGRLTTQVDPQMMLDLLAGPLYYHHLVLHRPMSAAAVDTHVTAVLDMLRS